GLAADAAPGCATPLPLAAQEKEECERGHPEREPPDQRPADESSRVRLPEELPVAPEPGHSRSCPCSARNRRNQYANTPKKTTDCSAAMVIPPSCWSVSRERPDTR